MFDILTSSPLVFIFWLLGLIVAITVHEFAHALIADKLGDPTPRLQGRLTLNPLAHMDPLGTIMLIVARFGWGKPVQYDPYNLQNPKRDSMFIALAGPTSNLILALGLSLIVRLSPLINPTMGILSQFLVPIIFMNVMLAVFNFLPMHPLDGGKIIVGLLPDDLAIEVDEFFHRYGQIVLILLILPFTPWSPVSTLISPVIQFILNLLLP